MIQEYFRLSDHLEDLKLPAASDRAVWDSLPEGVRGALIRRGEEYLGWHWPVMTCGDYLTFSRTGDRSRYEQKCHPRQQALCALALAECAEHRGRFLDELIDGIWFVCEESGWQLPAHNLYIRDTTPLPLPDTARPVPDLFACETAANLSLILALLGEELEAAAGSIRLEGAGEPAVEAVPIQDAHLRRSWPDTLYRALVPVQGTLRLEFLP